MSAPAPASVVTPLLEGDCELYVMTWPEESFTKVGISKNQRWRKFVRRGARPLVVLRLEADQARALESYAHSALEHRLNPMFPTAARADRYLGAGGAGYSECYRDDGSRVVPIVLGIASRFYPGYERVAV